MFSIKIRVAFSVLVIRTASASARAFSASARAFSASALALRTVAFMVAIFTKRAMTLPPRSMFRASLKDIVINDWFD